jgi:biopolymer transport protein TolR
MLVLLIIFMVSAPLMPSGVVDLPSVGKAKQAPDQVVEVVLESDDRIKLRINRKDAGEFGLNELKARVKAIQEDNANGAEGVPVIISARKDVRYEVVVHIMDELKQAGVARVGLSVRTTGG